MVPIDGYYASMIFLLILQWITALGRVAIRIFIVRKFGLDDIALVITLLVSSAFFACYVAITELTNGGKANGEIDLNNLFPAINTTLGMLVLYILGTMMLKIALGLLLLRVLVKRWQVFTIYSLMAVSVIYGIMYFFVVLFECGPPKQFAFHIAGGQCLSPATIDGLGYAHGAIIALIDCIFAFLPVALIRNTDMSQRSKVSVAIILGFGSVACVCTFVRLGYINTLSKSTWTFFETSKTIALLSGAELSIGITCVSLSCYKPLFRRFFWTHQTYYYDGSASAGQDARQTPEHPLQQLPSETQTWNPMSPPLSRQGLRTYHEDWPRKGKPMSRTSPISPVKL